LEPPAGPSAHLGSGASQARPHNGSPAAFANYRLRRTKRGLVNRKPVLLSVNLPYVAPTRCGPA